MKQKNQMKRLARRIWVMVACAVMVMAVFVLQLINFQLVNGEYYLQQAENTQVYNFEVSAARGDIVDRYGRSIATNRTGYKVELSKGMMTGDLNETLKELVEILQRNGESWNDTLPLTTTQPFAYTVDQTADSTDNPTLARQQRRLETLKERFGKQTYATADELLESMADPSETTAYPHVNEERDGVRVFDWRTMIRALMQDQEAGVSHERIAARFMNTLCAMALDQCRVLNPEHLPVVLSGGSFLNLWLLQKIKDALQQEGYAVYWHQHTSCSDEGIALGQLAIAMERM